MPKAFLGKDGSLRLPKEFLSRRGLSRDVECWVKHRDGAIVLLPRLPDLRKLYVEPTTLCNLECRTCIRNVWETPKTRMELAAFRSLVDQLKEFPNLQRVVFSGLGEPLTHPDILEMVRLVRELDLAVTIGSNGLLLDEAKSRELVRLGVDRLVVSLDGVSPETYGDVRGAEFFQVIDNIRLLNEAKKELGSLTPALGIEFVALKSNIDELGQLSGFASRLGASRVLVSNVLAYTDEMRDEILYGYEPRPPFNAASWPVKVDAWITWGTLDLPRMHWSAEQRCRFVRDRSAVVTPDGGVTPCYALSHDYSYLTIDGRRKQVARYTLGNLTEQSLLEIWTSEDYCGFRREVQEFHFPSCPDCDLRESCDLREKRRLLGLEPLVWGLSLGSRYHPLSMSGTMKVYVRLYAFLAERVSEALKEQFPEGVRPGYRLELELPDESTLENLVDRLDLQRHQAKLVFVNGEARPIDYGLKPEDEVGIFPPVAGGSGKSITVDVWLYGALARYGGDAAGKVHARLDMDLPAGSELRDLLEKLSLPTEERGITFVNGTLSAMPGRQPDLDHVLENGDRVAFFHLSSMWPFQYRHGVTMTPDLEREMNEEKSAFHHRK